MFSATVKEEILDNMNSRKQCDACTLGMLLFCRQLSDSSICLLTESEKVSAFFSRNLSRISSKDILVDNLSRGSKTVYRVDISDTETTNAIFKYFSVDTNLLNHSIMSSLPKQKLISSMISGAFLVCGSVNDPNKNSHLEFVVPGKEIGSELADVIMNECSVCVKQSSRGNKNIVYLKDSESIQDILIYIGASASALKHITTKVDKEGNNRINRSINCTYANMKKLNDAAEKQITAINKLKADGIFDTLDDELKAVAVARKNNPDLPLSELCLVFTPAMSRSTLNRKLNKLIELAKE